jgi:hypothetical protein
MPGAVPFGNRFDLHGQPTDLPAEDPVNARKVDIRGSEIWIGPR